MDQYSLDYNKNVSPRTGGLLIDALQTIVYALAISVIVYLFIAIPNKVDGESMLPNLHHNDILLTNKVVQIFGGEGHLIGGYDYERGDIIVFQQPGRPDLVKRIVGLPGEKVMLSEGNIYINNKILVEEYLPAGIKTEEGSFLPEGVEKRIPDDSYLAFGDNRGNSKDSRASEVGFVKRKYIKGSPFIRLLPLDKFGLLARGESQMIDSD